MPASYPTIYISHRISHAAAFTMLRLHPELTDEDGAIIRAVERVANIPLDEYANSILVWDETDIHPTETHLLCQHRAGEYGFQEVWILGKSGGTLTMLSGGSFDLPGGSDIYNSVPEKFNYMSGDRMVIGVGGAVECNFLTASLRMTFGARRRGLTQIGAINSNSGIVLSVQRSTEVELRAQRACYPLSDNAAIELKDALDKDRKQIKTATRDQTSRISEQALKYRWREPQFASV